MRKEDLQLVKEYVDKYIMKDKPELVLITGSKVFGIQKSDFNLCVVGAYPRAHLKVYSNFVSIKKYPSEFNGQRFEVELANWDYIKDSLQDYSSFLAWHFQQAFVLYDKKKKFEKLKQKYGNMTKKELKEIVFELFELAYDNYSNARKAETRAFPATMKLHIAEAIDSLLKIYYLINKRFVPPLKWRIFLLDEIKLKPSILTERGLENLSIKTLEILMKKTESILLLNKIMLKRDFNIIYSE